MYIEPNTNIRLLKNVPLDTSYKNTYYFKNETEQYEHFIKFTKRTLTKQTYQRVNKGIARVGYKAEDLYDCNYMMFQNENFGTKWFYAFITSVEYVNNTVSEIKFEIDVLQTWLLSCTFKECFVEREHSSTDVIGENTVPENLETGEYVCDSMEGTGLMSKLNGVVASTFEANNDFKDATGYVYTEIYSGLHFDRYETAEDLRNCLQDERYAKKSEGVVSVFMMPEKFASDKPGDPAKSYDIHIKKNDIWFGFKPHNNKLFTYPYNFLYVSNLDGESAVFHYEHWNNDEWCYFKATGDYSCNPSVILYPCSHKGLLANLDEKLVLTGFPQCAWNVDTFRAWLSQQGPSTVINSAINTASSLLSGNPVAVGGTLVREIGGLVSKSVERAIQPPQAKGSASPSVLVACKQKDFAFIKKHIREEYARIIDEYFDMYGYATHRVKVPNRSARPCWNFVKTVGCTIVGGAPADDISKICKIHDAGVTYWKPTAVFGTYNYDVNNNSITTTEE